MPGEDKGLFKTLLYKALGFEDDQPLPPEAHEAIKIAKQERPDLAEVQPYGPFSRGFMNKAAGFASPGRTIYLNPSHARGKDPQVIADTLIHEQTHIDQANKRGGGLIREILRMATAPSNIPYGQRPDEMEAWQAERARRSRMGRPQEWMPSFSGPIRKPEDVNLPLPRK